MPVIYSRTFATGQQQYLSLSNDSFTRQLTIGSNWNRIRIGILCALPTINENAWGIRSGVFGLGICNGASSGGSAQAPAHQFGWYVGGYPSYTTPTLWTYNAGSAGNSYFSNAAFFVHKVAAGVVTTATVGSFTTTIPSNTTLGGALARRGLFIVDINKSALISGNMTMGASSGAVAHMALDLASTDLYQALEWVSTAPVIQGTALTNLALGNSLAFNETTNGMLDTVFLFWNLYAFPLQLYELAVYRVG